MQTKLTLYENGHSFSGERNRLGIGIDFIKPIIFDSGKSQFRGSVFQRMSYPFLSLFGERGIKKGMGEEVYQLNTISNHVFSGC